MATSTADDDKSNAWMRLAACSGLDTNMFHSEAVLAVEQSKAICAQCRVVKECLEFALPHDRANSFDSGMGIYGGLTPSERKNFWRRLQRTNQPAYLARQSDG